ncbi:MAG: hypothetical protein Q3M24_23025 [Candidatus Electrothrix aestuarii]|uniref:Uncharacterized protein n=1 Tax=Candidatus Electrothrix aestuarii TaxID=3062594 RepID=A0AAU8LVB4_9BACT|nr:hypothetical protein [Candidatus Electrothrix aestuarii]
MTNNIYAASKIIHNEYYPIYYNKKYSSISENTSSSLKKIPYQEKWIQSLLDPIYLTPNTLKIIIEETGVDVTYRLTEQSLAALEKKYPRITEKQYDKLEAVKETNFKKTDQEWANVASTLAFLELLHQGLSTRYLIRDDLFKKLTKEKMPQYLLDGLMAKKGVIYLDLSMLTRGMQRQIQETILAYKAQVMEQASFLNMVYFLNENSFLILKGKEMPPELVDSLVVLKNEYFLSKSKLSREVRNILTKFAKTLEQAWLEKIVSMVEKDGKIFTIKGNQLRKLLIRLSPKLVGEIKKENKKGYTAKSLCTLFKENPSVLENYFYRNPRLLSSLGIQVSSEYTPTADKALQIQERGVQPVVVAAFKELDGTSYNSKENYIQALRVALDKLNQPPPPCPAPPQKRSVASPSSDCSVEPEPTPSKIAQALFNVEKQAPPHETKPIQFDPDNCGCVAVPKNSTYALYPYWTAQGKEQTIDFSVISRLAYFYLEVNEKNKIEDRRHWLDDKDQNNFITVARKHKTKVDLVLYKEQWCGQSEQADCPSRDKKEELAETISNLLKPTLNHLKPYATFGMAPTPTMGDGIIIYLTSIPHDSECFLSFIKMLREKIQTPVRDTTLGARITHLLGHPPKRVPQRRLSLMLPGDILMLPDDMIIQEKDKLQDVIDFLEKISARPARYFDDIVVLTGNNPLDKLQELRGHLEDNIGSEYIDINKKITPLFVNTCGQKQKGNEINLTFNYARENFGGIGFIPFPLQTENATETKQAEKKKKKSKSSETEQENKPAQEKKNDEQDTVALCGGTTPEQAIKNAIESKQEEKKKKESESSAAKQENDSVQEEKNSQEKTVTVCSNISSDQIMGSSVLSCQADQADFVSRFIKQYAPWLCKWTCPNRMWIRLTWDGLVLFFVVYFILALFYPSLAEIRKRYQCIFVILGIITVLLIYMSYACDPDYKEYTTDFLIYTLVILAVGIASSARKRLYP